MFTSGIWVSKNVVVGRAAPVDARALPQNAGSDLGGCLDLDHDLGKRELLDLDDGARDSRKSREDLPPHLYSRFDERRCTCRRPFHATGAGVILRWEPRSPENYEWQTFSAHPADAPRRRRTGAR